MNIDMQNAQWTLRPHLQERDQHGCPRCFKRDMYDHVVARTGQIPQRPNTWSKSTMPKVTLADVDSLFELPENYRSTMLSHPSHHLSKCFICSTLISLGNRSIEALLDSCINSITKSLVLFFNLPTLLAHSIFALSFGDHSQAYWSCAQVHWTFYWAHDTFTHSFYFLPHQLFLVTIGCDWFI